MKFRVGSKKGTVILDEVGSVVTEFTYKKAEGEAQRLANEYVAFKNAAEPTDEEINAAGLDFYQSNKKVSMQLLWKGAIEWYKRQTGR